VIPWSRKFFAACNRWACEPDKLLARRLHFPAVTDHLPAMPLPLTNLEKRALAVLALLIVLGLIGLAVL